MGSPAVPPNFPLTRMGEFASRLIKIANRTDTLTPDPTLSQTGGYRMGVGKKLLSSMLAASVLLSAGSAVALADTPDRSELPELKRRWHPRAERTITTKSQPERVVTTDLTRDRGVRQYFVELEGPSGVEMQVKALQGGVRAQNLASMTPAHLQSLERNSRPSSSRSGA